jgi:thioredoxin reductase (NADPH)
VVVEDLRSGKRRSISCDGVFIFAGMRPNLDLFEGMFDLDLYGYVATDAHMRTNIKDVFAAGDLRSKSFRQITTAVADGTIAAITATKELEHTAAA